MPRSTANCRLAKRRSEGPRSNDANERSARRSKRKTLLGARRSAVSNASGEVENATPRPNEADVVADRVRTVARPPTPPTAGAATPLTVEVTLPTAEAILRTAGAIRPTAAATPPTAGATPPTVEVAPAPTRRHRLDLDPGRVRTEAKRDPPATPIDLGLRPESAINRARVREGRRESAPSTIALALLPERKQDKIGLALLPEREERKEDERRIVHLLERKEDRVRTSLRPWTSTGDVERIKTALLTEETLRTKIVLDRPKRGNRVRNVLALL